MATARKWGGGGAGRPERRPRKVAGGTSRSRGCWGGDEGLREGKGKGGREGGVMEREGGVRLREGMGKGGMKGKGGRRDRKGGEEKRRKRGKGERREEGKRKGGREGKRKGRSEGRNVMRSD